MTPAGTHSLTFPCDFIFKIIGRAEKAFEIEALGIMRKHFPNMSEGAISLNLSKNGKYLAFSVKVIAESQEQLDGAYQDLSKSPLILFAL